MADDDFRGLLLWAYRGEIRGEALFHGLAEQFPDAADKLLVLAELERRMAAVLSRPLTDHEIEAGDTSDEVSRGRELAAASATLGWQQFLAQFSPVTERALIRYRALRDLSPSADPAFDLVIDHEVALQDFARAEIAGTDDSLASVRGVIERLGVSSTSR